VGGGHDENALDEEKRLEEPKVENVWGKYKAKKQ
jgi:hypothetical protein